MKKQEDSQFLSLDQTIAGWLSLLTESLIGPKTRAATRKVLYFKKN